VADLDRRLVAVAATNHSIITLADVVDAGGSASDAHRRVASGRWEAAGRGVYRIAGTPWTYDAAVFAAVCAAGPGAIASHLCAARLLGLGFRRADPEITIPRGRRHRPKGIRTHESTDLHLCEVRLVAGIPVTDPDRTLLDLGRYIRPPALRRAAEEARRQDLVTWKSLAHALMRHARQGRHGVRSLREVVSDGLRVDGITDTDSELIAITLLLEHGLAEPVLHHRIRGDEGEVLAELDLAWPDRRAAIEIDGTVHNDPVVRAKDEARDHWLRGLGWTIRRVWCEIPVLHPARFLQTARNLLSVTSPTSDPRLLAANKRGLRD
jgi:Transcriptional regulator, AbiEi antitoxin/Protein of unknown function (DUF559)